jgi:hypothetical protein
MADDTFIAPQYPQCGGVCKAARAGPTGASQSTLLLLQFTSAQNGEAVIRLAGRVLCQHHGFFKNA